jgi:DNA-binding MarR family transcriptional regulator
MSKSTFGFDKPELSSGFLLWQVSTIWQRKIKHALSEFGVSHPQFVMMALLLWCHEQGISPNQSYLIEQTQLDKMTVSNTLKRLVSEGLVKRVACEEDTRAKRITLSKVGMALTKKCVPVVEGIDAQLFKPLNKHQSEALNAALYLLVSAADEAAE